MRDVQPEILRISSEDLPERDRIAMWREVFGRQLCRLDIEPLPDFSFRTDLTAHTLPGLVVVSGMNSGSRQWRTHELISDGNDDFLLHINRKGRVLFSQRGQELVLDEREAALLSAAEIGGVTQRSLNHFHLLRLPRTMITPLLPRADDVVMRLLPPNSPILQLLTGYLRILEENHALITPQTIPLIVTQIHNLVAATISPTRDTMELAKCHGIREARLATIRADILANLSQVRLSPRTIASRHGVSDRYVHLLFEETGQTFNQFVEEERLKRAFALLTDPMHVDVRIGEIATRTGFPEHSTFHRAFRRRFGDTPGNVRRDRMEMFFGSGRTGSGERVGLSDWPPSDDA